MTELFIEYILVTDSDKEFAKIRDAMDRWKRYAFRGYIIPEVVLWTEKCLDCKCLIPHPGRCVDCDRELGVGD